MDQSTLLAALERHFGFREFHVGQAEVIEDVLNGKATLAVMPTGAGKSLCYQLPALLLGGTTLVVSPLIALMKDQVDGLRARGINADCINSHQSADEQRLAIGRMMRGESRLVYVAPERFRSAGFVRLLTERPPVLFAVDEAHCISQWGHDFRPDYARLGEVISRVKPERLLACTATATPDVRMDILRALGVEQATVHVAGFLRPNLFLEAQSCASDVDRQARLLGFIDEHCASGSVICYASTRKRVESFGDVVTRALGKDKVAVYHAGMADGDRARAQDHFMRGEAKVVVATTAFGMGIDRADVRGVVHLDLPRNLEGYYQEVGRAGRDGLPSSCLLLHGGNDARVHEFLIDQSHPPRELISAVWRALVRHGEDGCAARSLVGLPGIESESMVEAVTRVLLKVDAIQVDGAGNFRRDPDSPVDLAELGLDFGALSAHGEAERERLRRMVRFARTTDCRHKLLLDYFGDPDFQTCPGCDRCSPERATGGGMPARPVTEAEAPLVRSALEGVSRAQGRFGVRKVAAMLAGARSRDLEGTSLLTLPTYGALRGLGGDGCLDLLRRLIDGDLCRLDGGEYPLIVLTRRGEAVLKGREVASLRGPPPTTASARVAPVLSKRAALLKGTTATPAKGPSPTPSLKASDPTLAARLRQWRLERAREREVPPYVIFSDRTLAELATRPPSSASEFLDVPGLGPGRWEAFGPALLAELRDAVGPPSV